VERKVLHPVATVRDMLLSLERRATEEGAGGAVEGAMAELRAQIPQMTGPMTRLFDELTAAVADFRDRVDRSRSVEEVAGKAGAAFTDGALRSFQQHWDDGGLPFHRLELRAAQMLDRFSKFANARVKEVKTPADRSRLMARGVVQGASSEIHAAIPQLTEDLRSFLPLADELGRAVGQGAVRGVVAGLAPWRKSALLAAGAVGAGLFVLLAQALRGRR
jgi:hypothetical protein